MKTPLAIGLGLACFAAGVLVTKLSEPAAVGGDPTGRNASDKLTVLDGRAISSQGGFRGGGGRPATTKELLELMDVFDEAKSEKALTDRLEGCGVEDLVAMLRLVDKEGVGARKDLAIELIGKQFGKKHPKEAFEFATDPRNRRYGDHILTVAIEQMLLDSPEEALDAVISIDERQIKRSAIHTLVNRLVSIRPELIGDWFAQEDIAKQLSSHSWFMQNALSNWASHDPKAAANFAMSLPVGDIQEGGIRGAAEIWAKVDPEAALAWAGGIGDSLLRDAAIRSMVGPLISKDP